MYAKTYVYIHTLYVSGDREKEGLLFSRTPTHKQFFISHSFSKNLEIKRDFCGEKYVWESHKLEVKLLMCRIYLTTPKVILLLKLCREQDDLRGRQMVLDRSS